MVGCAVPFQFTGYLWKTKSSQTVSVSVVPIVDVYIVVSVF